MSNPIKAAAARLFGAATAITAAGTAASSYEQECRDALATEAGARALAERLRLAEAALVAGHSRSYSPRGSLIHRQLSQTNIALEGHAWNAGVAAANEALAKAVQINAAELADVTTKLANAEARVERCTTEVQQRRRKAAPHIRAAEEADAARAATLARDEADALAALTAAEARGDDNAAQAAAERLALAQANLRNQATGSKSVAALRAGVLAGLVDEAQAQLNTATSEVAALRERQAIAQLKAACHQSDQTATLHLLAAGEVLHRRVHLVRGSNSVGKWNVPTVAVADIEHVPGARQSMGPHDVNRLLPERVVERAAAALRPINFSVFEVDPATLSSEYEDAATDAAGQGQKLAA